MVRIQLCGRFAVVIDGQPTESRLPGRQGRLLVAYLATFCVICECGYVMRDDDEDRVVALVRDHIRTDHPELLDMATPETIRTWIEITT